MESYCAQGVRLAGQSTIALGNHSAIEPPTFHHEWWQLSFEIGSVRK
jgi:hypothetical protein